MPGRVNCSCFNNLLSIGFWEENTKDYKGGGKTKTKVNSSYVLFDQVAGKLKNMLENKEKDTEDLCFI